MNEINFDAEYKKERVFEISDTLYKVLCHADPKNLDANKGLENLAMMYLSLQGSINFDELAIKMAKARAKKMKLY